MTNKKPPGGEMENYIDLKRRLSYECGVQWTLGLWLMNSGGKSRLFSPY